MSKVSPDPMSHDARGNSGQAHRPDSRQQSGARVYAHRNTNPTVSADWWVPSGLFVLRKCWVTNSMPRGSINRPGTLRLDVQPRDISVRLSLVSRSLTLNHIPIITPLRERPNAPVKRGNERIQQT